MNINIVCCLFVLVNEKNTNIRKNDLKKIKVVVDKKNKNLLNVKFDNKTDIKDLIRKYVSKTINSDIFHLEQVYTLGDSKFFKDKNLDIIYIGVTNLENINLNDEYELIDFNVENNNLITFQNNRYDYKTIEKEVSKNIEYIHNICTTDIVLEKKLLELLIAFKYLKSRIDNTDIIFKFMPEYFTLEDVRIVYEMIKEISVDKSNFRKKIVKYCVETKGDNTKKGYRPSKLYTFKTIKGDIWL